MSLQADAADQAFITRRIIDCCLREDIRGVVSQGLIAQLPEELTHYLPALGQRMLDTWHQLSPQEQQALRQDKQRCGEILREKQQGKSS